MAEEAQFTGLRRIFEEPLEQIEILRCDRAKAHMISHGAQPSILVDAHPAPLPLESQQTLADGSAHPQQTASTVRRLPGPGHRHTRPTRKPQPIEL